MKVRWVTAAMTNDAMVADLLLRMKQSSSADSSAIDTALLPTVRWGRRKSRSKPSAIAIATNTNAGGLRKEQLSGSPTTPLYWSGGGGGGGASTSDGYDESSRPSDLSSGGRSTKGEGATTSSYKKSRKRKSFAELKKEEDFLLKEKLHLNRELESMRLTMNKQITTSQSLKKFKINFDQNAKLKKEKIDKMLQDEQENGFFLPDLNIAPDVEEL